MSRKKILIPIIILTVLIIVIIILLNRSTRYNKLSINDNKWETIKSARSENKRLVLEDIEFNGYNLIIDEKNNNLYYSLVNDNKTKYNPNVSFKASDKKAKLAILSDEITVEKVKENHSFKLMLYNDSEYHVYNLVCTDLPILNISYKENAENKQKNIPMEMYLFDNLTDKPNRITISSGKLKKNSNNYTFSLDVMTPGKNIRENRISILNMKPSSEYILKKTNSEEEETQIDMQNTSQRVEFFINNEYIGIYELEHNIRVNNREQKLSFSKYI